MPAPRRKLRRERRRKTFLVLVEGEVTEEGYLLFWKRRLREQCLVDTPNFHGTPMSLVRKAIAIKGLEAKEDRRGRGRMHDEYWCVFDVDTHPYLEDAIDLARTNGIRTAISNPCVELWFLLHFVDQQAFIERDDAQKAAKAALGCGKHLTTSALDQMLESFEVAKERAQNLDGKHLKDGTPYPANPSSGLWKLIDSMRRGR